MFNRRVLRIKVFQQLYAYIQDEKGNRTLHEKNLMRSVDKVYEIYIFLLALPAELLFYAGKEIDIQEAKYFPQEGIINPLKALQNNQAMRILERSEYIAGRMKAYKLGWTGSGELIRKLMPLLKQNELFMKYSEKTEHSFSEDQKMLSEIYQVFIGESELLEHYLEEKFLSWEDDQVLVTSTLLKSIDMMRHNSSEEFISKIDTADEEGERMMTELFRKTLEQDQELTHLIASKTQNWEPDRIAFVDMLLMKMALCEILYFPHIPVKVSINEYLELAKLYSTPNSHGFINGILDKVQLDLRRENRVQKQGRGLVE